MLSTGKWGVMLTGISIYPNIGNYKRVEKKLEEAKNRGINIVFTSIQLDNLNFENASNEWNVFEFFFNKCKKLNFKVSVDISKASIKKLGVVNITDLNPLKKYGIFSLRIDSGYTIDEICTLTKNKLGIVIEINASMIENLELMLSKINLDGNIKNVFACHNFFPRQFTGLGWKRFQKYNEIIKEYKIKIGAFVSTNNSKGLLSITTRGVPTIEAHRFEKIEYQVNDFIANNIDYLIISEPDYSNKELDAFIETSQHNYVEIFIENSCIEQNLKEKISSQLFTVRPDQPEFIRRFDERLGKVVPFNNIAIKKFDLTIDNVHNGHYSGEIQIALKNFERTFYVNVVGNVVKQQRNLVLFEAFIKNKVKIIFI